MGIMKVKRIIFYLLVIGIVAVISGCVRYPGEPGPEPGETEYQLEVTVEVAGIIDSSDGMYYIVMDADGDSVDGPRAEVNDWDDEYYYLKLENDSFYFAQVKDDVETFYGGTYSENKLQATIPLSDLEDPNSIDINILTTDSENITYDSLDNGYFTINAKTLGYIPDILDDHVDSQDGVDFDIVKVTAKITIP